MSERRTERTSKLKGRRRRSLIYSYLIAPWFIGIPFAFFVISLYVRVPSNEPQSGLALGAFFIVWISGILVLSAKSTRNQLSAEEDLLLWISESIVSLENFQERGKDADRIEALKRLKSALGSIKGWTFGNLAVTKNTIGKQAEGFRDRFENRLIPAAEGNDSVYRNNALNLLKALEKHLVSGDLGNLGDRNMEIDLQFPPEEKPSKSNPRFRDYMFGTTTRRFTTITTGCLIAGGAAYFLSLASGSTGAQAVGVGAGIFSATFVTMGIFFRPR